MHGPLSHVSKSGNPLNWSPADKGWLVFLLTAVLHTQYLGWTLMVLADPRASAFMDMTSLRAVQPLVVGITLTSWVLAGVMTFGRRIQPEAQWHEHFCNQYYGLTLCVFSYLTGTMTMATGVVLAGAPVLGFILFRTGPVLWSLGVAVTVIVSLTIAANKGLVEYAPVVLNPLGADGRLADFWLTSMSLFVGPHLAIITALSWYVLSGWRRREEAVRYLSMTDSLTRLPNRRSVLAMLEREREHSTATRRPLSVVMIDLDHFKQLNDSYGHAAGDIALQEAARRLRLVMRQTDHLGRFGGEEFLMVLPGVDVGAAEKLAERCRDSLQASPLELDDGRCVALSASLGVCSNQADLDMPVRDLLHQADQALYEAKARGRNQVVAAQPPESAAAHV